MYDHDAPTEPLPAVGSERRLTAAGRRLAALACASWLAGGALTATQITALAHAPRPVRCAVWSVAVASLALGLLALACCAATAVLVAVRRAARDAEAERQTLRAAGDTALAGERERHLALALRAAALPARARRPAQGERHMHLIKDTQTRDRAGRGAAG